MNSLSVQPLYLEEGRNGDAEHFGNVFAQKIIMKWNKKLTHKQILKAQLVTTGNVSTVVALGGFIFSLAH